MGECASEVPSDPFIKVKSFLPNKVLPSDDDPYKIDLNVLGAYT